MLLSSDGRTGIDKRNAPISAFIIDFCEYVWGLQDFANDEGKGLQFIEFDNKERLLCFRL